MTDVASHSLWVDDPLATEDPDHLLAAQAAALRLVVAAREIVDGSTAAAVCPSEMVTLAVKLTEVSPVPGVVSPAVGTPTEAGLRYLRLLAEASGTVSACRRFAHPGGRCWFSVNGPSDDVCARVLAAGHRLG
jgi:hypothetical protein